MRVQELAGAINERRGGVSCDEPAVHYLRLSQRTQRVANYYVLPTEGRDRTIVAFGESSACVIGRQQVIRTRAHGEVRLIGVAGCAGSTFMNVVGGHGLRSAGEPEPVVR